MTLAAVEELRTPVNQELVEMLEALLGEAKCGDLQSLIGVGNMKDGGSVHYICVLPKSDLLRLIGHADRVKRRLNIMLDERNEGV